MKKKFIFIASCGVVVAGMAIWQVWAPDMPKQMITAQPTTTALEAEAVPDSSVDEQLPPHLRQIQADAEKEKVIAVTSAERDALELEAKLIQAELSELTKDLDKNLENDAERKIIEERYASITHDYNEIVLQIVKASPRATDE